MAVESIEKKIMIKVDDDLKAKFKLRMDEYGKNKDFSKSLRAAMTYMLTMTDEELDKMFALSDTMNFYKKMWNSQKFMMGTSHSKSFDDKLNPVGAYEKFWKAGTNQSIEMMKELQEFITGK